MKLLTSFIWHKGHFSIGANIQPFGVTMCLGIITVEVYLVSKEYYEQYEEMRKAVDESLEDLKEQGLV